MMKLRPSSLGKPLSRVQAGYWPEPRSADPQAVVILPLHSASKANTRAADLETWQRDGDEKEKVVSGR